MYYTNAVTRHFSTSIVVPCKNESGNLKPLIETLVSNIRSDDEIIIVEGNSSDSTYTEALDLQSKFPKHIITLKQLNQGKFDAVLTGVKFSNCEIIMIWDADATVNFDQNFEIYSYSNLQPALITGNRLNGKRDKGAMKPLNLLGNWAFAILWGVLARKKPIDLLCGTKKFPRSLLENSPTWLHKLDPYGDFSLIAIAINKKLPIISIPVHYHARSHGATNIRRWKDGFKLLSITIIIHYKLLFKVFK
jgi:glycosyltransferase involved in cell wall biosynthesis